MNTRNYPDSEENAAMTADNQRAVFAAKMQASLEQESVSMGVLMIATERARQLTEERWSAEHDDEHTRFELSRAAGSFLLSAQCRSVEALKEWPFSQRFQESRGIIGDLVKAGALIAAEIDRLLRKGQ